MRRREEQWVADVLATVSRLLAFNTLFLLTDLGSCGVDKAVMRWGKQLAGKGEVLKGLPLRDLANGRFECFVWGLALFNIFVNGLNNAAENR